MGQRLQSPDKKQTNTSDFCKERDANSNVNSPSGKQESALGLAAGVGGPRHSGLVGTSAQGY